MGLEDIVNVHGVLVTDPSRSVGSRNPSTGPPRRMNGRSPTPFAGSHRAREGTSKILIRGAKWETVFRPFTPSSPIGVPGQRDANAPAWVPRDRAAWARI